VEGHPHVTVVKVVLQDQLRQWSNPQNQQNKKLQKSQEYPSRITDKQEPQNFLPFNFYIPHILPSFTLTVLFLLYEKKPLRQVFFQFSRTEVIEKLLKIYFLGKTSLECFIDKSPFSKRNALKQDCIFFSHSCDFFFSFFNTKCYQIMSMPEISSLLPLNVNLTQKWFFVASSPD